MELSGKAALENGSMWKRRRENMVLKRTVGYSPLMGGGGSTFSTEAKEMFP
jgi:hypothetical protein